MIGLSAQESAVVEYGREYFRTRRVSQATFDAALAQFGVRGLAELTSLMGYYAMLAFNINAFEMLPRPAMKRRCQCDAIRVFQPG